jgi:hypothetical protein
MNMPQDDPDYLNKNKNLINSDKKSEFIPHIENK